MNFFYYLSLLPQILAMIHYFKTRPEGYWFWIILFFGPLGAILYFAVMLFSGNAVEGVQNAVAGGFKERRNVARLEAKIRGGEALPYDYFELGEMLFRLKRFKEAASSLEVAVQKDPADMDAKFYLGLSLEQTGRAGEACKYLETVVKKDPKFKFGDAMHGLARCRRKAGETGPAIEAYRKVLAQSNFAEAKFALAELLLSQGNRTESRELLQKLIWDVESGDLPSYQLRKDRQWARKAKSLLTTI